jgi:hypothetical protein
MLEGLPPSHQDRRTITDGFSEQIAMIAVFVWALDEAGHPAAQHGLTVLKIKLSEAKANDGEREEW